MKQRHVGGYQGYGAPSEQELLEAMAAKEGNFSPVQKVPDSYNPDALNRDRDLLYAMQGNALDSSPTTLAGGLSRLGQAWLARGADKRITAREDEMRAADETKAMQAQQKRDEMITAMVGGDEQAFAALYPEEFAKNQFEMQRDAAKQDPFVVNDQIVDRTTGEATADFRDPEPAQERWEQVPAPEGMPGMYERSTLTGQTRRVAAPQRNGITVGADGSVQIGGPAQTGKLLDPPQVKGKDPSLVFDADGFARVSPSAQQKGLNTAALKFNDLKAKNDLVSDDISRALDHFTAVNPETGVREVNPEQKSVGAYAALSQIPFFGGSTEAGTMESFLTTLQANVGFGELQAMREASPTGGALGQVSEREIAFLQALLGDIEQTRDPKILMYNLERLDTFMAGRQQRFQEAFEADYPSAGEYVDRREGARTDVESLIEKYAGGN